MSPEPPELLIKRVPIFPSVQRQDSEEARERLPEGDEELGALQEPGE